MNRFLPHLKVVTYGSMATATIAIIANECIPRHGSNLFVRKWNDLRKALDTGDKMGITKYMPRDEARIRKHCYYENPDLDDIYRMYGAKRLTRGTQEFKTCVERCLPKDSMCRQVMEYNRIQRTAPTGDICVTGIH